MAQPLRVIETLADGVAMHDALPSVTQTEPWGLIKLSAQNIAVHMQLSLCLSFQLIRSLGGYTLGTTVGFQVKTVNT
jgi:hypothetical protein